MDLTAELDKDGATALDGLERSVNYFPDKTAIYYGPADRAYSYAEFDSMTNSIAGNLAGHGVARGTVIAVAVSSPLVSVMCMYGIWKAGGIYAPINPGLSGALIRHQLDNSRPDILILDDELLTTLDEIVGQLAHRPRLSVVHPSANQEGAGPEWAQLVQFKELLREASRPTVAVEGHDIASIIYTSGTTGPAKGVVQTHRWGCHYTWLRRQMLTPEDVLYCDLPMYHVGGTMFLVGAALWVGATLSMWDRFSRSEFWDRIRGTGASCTAMVDVTAAWLLDNPPRDDDRDNSLNKVWLQPLPPTHGEFTRRFGIDFVTTGFAQSETGVAITALIIENEPGEGTPGHRWKGLSHQQMRDVGLRYGMTVAAGSDIHRKGYMGGTTPFTEVSIRNEHDRECEAEEIGQLCVRSRVPDIVLREYLGRPDATSAAFRNLWFHTGDAAVWASDGLFYYVDRLGDRIRVRGENFGSFEVEQSLLELPTISSAAVIGVPASEGMEDEVVAFLEPAKGAFLDLDEVREHCTRTLPKFMRPTHILVLETLPRTPTNKVQKYNLKRDFQETRSGASLLS